MSKAIGANKACESPWILKLDWIPSKMSINIRSHSLELVELNCFGKLLLDDVTHSEHFGIPEYKSSEQG